MLDMLITVMLQARNQTFARGGSSAEGTSRVEAPEAPTRRRGGVSPPQPTMGSGGASSASKFYTFCQSFDGLWRR